MDILNINGSKFSSSDDATTFQHPNYNLQHRDREINGGSGQVIDHHTALIRVVILIKLRAFSNTMRF